MYQPVTCFLMITEQEIQKQDFTNIIYFQILICTNQGNNRGKLLNNYL